MPTVDYLDPDTDDPRLIPYRALKHSNLTRWSGQFIAEGDKVVERMLRSDYEVVSIVIGRSWLPQFEPLFRNEMDVLVMEDDRIGELVGFEFHRGVLGCGKRPSRLPLEQLVASEQSFRTLVVCPNVQDSENLGAIIRNSAALGADGLLVGSESADPWSRRALRVSMGTAFQLPIRATTTLDEDLLVLRDRWGVERVAAVLDEGAEPLEHAQRAPRLAIMFGSEGHGLGTRWLSLSDRQVRLAMQRGVDSLNVAVASGVFLYQFLRNRGSSSGSTAITPPV